MANNRKEIQVVNDALQYWKGFSDALKEIHKSYDDEEFEAKYKNLYESSVASIELYNSRYIKLRRDSSEPKDTSKKKKRKDGRDNESRNFKRN